MESQDIYQERKRTVLIVEDNELNREMLSEILCGSYEIIEARDGLEGLEQLSLHYEELSLVLLDVYMPRCDGFEFLKRKMADNRYDSVPVIVATASSSTDDEVRCLELGANDFVVKPYNFDIIINRINNTIRLRESASIVNQLTWDALTNLYSQEFFYRRVDNLLTSNPEVEYDMVCSDIENFKSLNDRYGKQNCDQLLHDLAHRFLELLPDLVVGGRIGSDTFAFLITHQEDHDWIKIVPEISRGLLADNLSVKIGVVEHVDHKLAVSLTCDRATLAIETIKGTFGLSVAWYDDKLRQQQLIEHAIIETMEKALEDHEFTVYYQPKHDLDARITGGAEALVRWIHPKLGFISPGVFIPLFERNGFITRLDLYVCEEACKEIARCKRLGLPLVPISFNASRLDFDLPDLTDRIDALARKYDVDRSLLHVEITESAYSDNPERVISALEELRERGFRTELDDFGSGYSSLASLNMLPLDVMKLDMSIIQQASELEDFRIVQSAIQMAQFLGLKTVAEGVETKEEVVKLSSIGCDMIQGYYYAKPLRQQEFEDYLEKKET